MADRAARIEAAAKAALEYLAPTPYRDVQEEDVVRQLREALADSGRADGDE